MTWRDKVSAFRESINSEITPPPELTKPPKTPFGTFGSAIPAYISGKKDQHGITRAELQDIAGPDWPELEADPAALELFALAIETRRMREQGIVPRSYTAVTICARCGPVPIWPGCPPTVSGCSWCLNRYTGKPMPEAGPSNATAAAFGGGLLELEPVVHELVTLYRQANISNGPQQVNNSTEADSFPTHMRAPARTREIENSQNELLKAKPNEWLDIGTSTATGGANQAMEAMAAVNGTKDSGW